MKPFLQVAQDNEQSQWLPERIEAGRWSHTVTRVKPLTVLTAPVAREGAAGSRLIPGLPRLHLRATSSCVLGEEDSCSPASSLGHSRVLPLTCPSLPFPYLQGRERGGRAPARRRALPARLGKGGRVCRSCRLSISGPGEPRNILATDSEPQPPVQSWTVTSGTPSAH